MRRSHSLAAVAALLAAGAPLAASSAAHAEDGLVGSAYAVSVDATVAGARAVDLQPVASVTYPQGGSNSIVDIGSVTGGVATGSVAGISSKVTDGTLTSTAHLVDVEVADIAGLPHVVSAEVVKSDCSAARTGLTGASSIAGLKVLGQDVKLSAEPGTEISVVGTGNLGVAKVRLNEQIPEGDTLTVNAVHVLVQGPLDGLISADVVLSQSRCSMGGGDTGTGTTTPTTTTTPIATTTSAPGTTEPGTTTTTPASGSGDVPSTTATSDSNDPGVVPVANSGDLADTGVSTIVPMILLGSAAIGAGVFLMFRNRRRSATNGPSGD